MHALENTSTCEQLNRYECNSPEFPCGMTLWFAEPPIFIIKSQRWELSLISWTGG